MIFSKVQYEVNPCLAIFLIHSQSAYAKRKELLYLVHQRKRFTLGFIKWSIYLMLVGTMGLIICSPTPKLISIDFNMH